MQRKLVLRLRLPQQLHFRCAIFGAVVSFGPHGVSAALQADQRVGSWGGKKECVVTPVVVVARAQVYLLRRGRTALKPTSNYGWGGKLVVVLVVVVVRARV